MYSDRVETETGSRKTAKNRLGRQVTSKRETQGEDKWEHDLFDEDKPRISNRRIDSRDLRLMLQKTKHRGDLRETLSAKRNPQPRISNPPKFKREAARPAMNKVAGETKSETRPPLNKATKKKPQQADATVGSFLESLGLEKYSTAFQVEEVDMDALMHMTDDDLKAMLIPMGPRKKILLALGSKRA